MSVSALDQYRSVALELFAARAEMGGSLPTHVEVAFMERLGDIHELMTDEEMFQVERWLVAYRKAVGGSA